MEHLSYPYGCIWTLESACIRTHYGRWPQKDSNYRPPALVFPFYRKRNQYFTTIYREAEFDKSFNAFSPLTLYILFFSYCFVHYRTLALLFGYEFDSFNSRISQYSYPVQSAFAIITSHSLSNLCFQVYFAGLKCLKNVRAALCRGRVLKCSRCGRSGATIGCRVDRCSKTYHLVSWLIYLF